MGQVATPLRRRVDRPLTWSARLRAFFAEPAREARARRRYAEGLERAVERVSGRSFRLTAAVPVAPEAGGDARGALLDLAERLRQPRPVRAEGLALVGRLLSDGGGPLFYGPPGALRRAAVVALQALDTDASSQA
jgi:hypothetical protein